MLLSPGRQGTLVSLYAAAFGSCTWLAISLHLNARFDTEALLIVFATPATADPRPLLPAPVRADHDDAPLPPSVLSEAQVARTRPSRREMLAVEQERILPPFAGAFHTLADAHPARYRPD